MQPLWLTKYEGFHTHKLFFICEVDLPNCKPKFELISLDLISKLSVSESEQYLIHVDYKFVGRD